MPLGLGRTRVVELETCHQTCSKIAGKANAVCAIDAPEFAEHSYRFDGCYRLHDRLDHLWGKMSRSK
jgi:hypothetical protein